MSALELTRYLHVDTLELRKLPPGELVRQEADGLTGAADSFEGAVTSVAGKWQALEALYAAPEQDLVLRALDDPVAKTARFVENFRMLEEALDTFGAELVEINRLRLELADQTDAAWEALCDRIESMDREGASHTSQQAARDEATAELQGKADRLWDRYELARGDCLRTLGKISRCATDVVSSYPSATLDLTSPAREGMYAAYDKAVAPGAAPEDIEAFYAQLLLLGPELLHELGKRRPDAALLVEGMGAHDEAAFWTKLNYAQQLALAAALPGLVGNLEGAPYAVRDAANRTVLGLLRRHYNEAALNAGAGVDYDMSTRNLALGRIEEALGKEGGPGERYLLSLDPRTSAPLVAISVGNPDTAQYVSYLVPGMDSSPSDAVDMVRKAATLRDAQHRVGVDGSTAVVAYLGYDSPNALTVAGQGSANTGAPDLAAALDGLYLTRSGEGPVPRISVIAHSYGTTLASVALEQAQYRVAATVFLASAGVPRNVSVSDLQVDISDGRQEIYSTLAESDKLAGVGRFLGGRTDPADEEWGGHVFGSEDVVIDDDAYTAVDGHHLSGYLDKNSFSLLITALVTSGRGDEARALLAGHTE